MDWVLRKYRGRIDEGRRPKQAPKREVPCRRVRYNGQVSFMHHEDVVSSQAKQNKHRRRESLVTWLEALAWPPASLQVKGVTGVPLETLHRIGWGPWLALTLLFLESGGVSLGCLCRMALGICACSRSF